MNEYTIWHEASLVTMKPDNDFGIIPDGVLVVKKNEIAWVGHKKDLPKQFEFSGLFQSAQGFTLTPGLIDCHTHLVHADHRLAAFKHRLQGLTEEEIAGKGEGIGKTVKATREASQEKLLAESIKRMKKVIQGGVTTIEIKSGYGLDFATERKILQVSKQLAEHFSIDVQSTFLGAHILPKEYRNKTEYIHFIANEVLPALVGENLVDAVDGFCDLMAFNEKELAILFDQAQKYHLPIKLHAEQFSPGNGARLAAKYHAISADHLEFIDKEGVQALKAAGTVAVLLPGAYYFTQSKQKPPISLFREYQVPMAIATDNNPGTSPTTSLLLMLNMACLLFGLTPVEALQGVTKNAAYALGLGKIKGQLDPGYMADFVLWDIEDPAELAYRFGENNCVKVIKGGNVVYDKSIPL